MKNSNEKLVKLLQEIKRRGGAIIVAGVTLVTGMAYSLEAIAATQMSDDAEVYYTDIMMEQNPNLGANLDNMVDNTVYQVETEYYDVFDDYQVSARAETIFAEISKLDGLQEYTSGEIENMMMALGGRNPYKRAIEMSDILFIMNRVTNIMDKESLSVSTYYRGFSDDSEVKTIIPIPLMIPDETLGKIQLSKIYEMRKKMLLSGSREEAFPVVDEFVKYLYETYPTNGDKGRLGHDEVERTGYRLLALNYVLSTADIANAINPHAHIQGETKLPDGTTGFCDFTLEDLTANLIEVPCVQSEFLDHEMPVNYITDAILGTTFEATNSYQMVLE